LAADGAASLWQFWPLWLGFKQQRGGEEVWGAGTGCWFQGQ